MGRGGDDGGQGVAADELQHQQPGTAGTDPAGQRGEPVEATLPSTGSNRRPW